MSQPKPASPAEPAGVGASPASVTIPEEGAALFVWGVWGVLIGSLGLTLSRYGRRLPFCDDWDVIRVFVGNPGPTAAWFWEPHNEHRIVLPKVLFWGLYEWSGYDLRAGLIFNVLALGLLAALLLAVARTIRGRWSVADAALPLLILCWSNGAYQWAFNIQFTTGVLLAGASLAIIASSPRGLSAGRAAATGLVLVLMPMTGAQGLFLGAPLAAWAAATGAMQARGAWPGGRLGGVILMASSVATTALMGLYLVGLDTVSDGDDNHSGDAFEFLKAGYQLVNAVPFRAVPPFWRQAGAAIVLAYAVAAGGLGAALARGRRGPREWGMLSLLVSLGSLYAAVAWGRGQHLLYGGATGHYAMLSLPGLCWVYFSLELFGPSRLRRPLQAGLLCLGAVDAAQGLDAIHVWRDNHRIERQILADLEAGLGPGSVADRHLDYFASGGCGNPESLPELRRRIADTLAELRDAGIAPYDRLGTDTPEASRPGAPP